MSKGVRLYLLSFFVLIMLLQSPAGGFQYEKIDDNVKDIFNDYIRPKLLQDTSNLGRNNLWSIDLSSTDFGDDLWINNWRSNDLDTNDHSNGLGNGDLGSIDLLSQDLRSSGDKDLVSKDQKNIGADPFNPIVAQTTCLVPCNEIVSGGPAPDGIPSIDEPKFTSIADANLNDKELVIGVVIDGIARAYPYSILNWHEIVNDEFNGKRYAITYCPLTASGILFNVKEINNAELGTSGNLYQNNLVFYDRITKSYYSQMYGKGITGANLGVDVPKGSTIETTWKAWKQLYPSSQVLTRDTGYTRNYDSYPYGTYYTDSSIYFPTRFNSSDKVDSLYHRKEISMVIQDGFNAFVAPFSELGKSKVVNENIFNKSTVIFFNSDERLALAYNAEVDGTSTTFEVASGESYTNDETHGFDVYSDTFSGSTWNILGEAIDGEHKGEVLEQIPTYNAFWFAAITFFPNATLYSSEDVTQLSGTAPIGVNEGEVGKANNLSGFTFLSALPLVVLLVIRRKLKSRKK